MAELNINGTVKLLMDAQTFDSGFTKREFVITTKEQYPQDVKLEVTQQRVELLNDLSIGQDVYVFFNIRGNEYNGKYFVNLQAWKIEALASAPVAIPVAPVADSEDDEDSPF